MARIRTIKPEFWQHEALSALPPETHMLAAALLNYADDEGYFNANPKLVKAACSPLRDDSVSIQCSLSALSNVGYLRLGTGPDGRLYGWIVKFLDHQNVNRPRPSKIRELDVDWCNAVIPQCGLSDGSSLEWNGMEWNGTRERPRTGEELPSEVATKKSAEGWA